MIAPRLKLAVLQYLAVLFLFVEPPCEGQRGNCNNDMAAEPHVSKVKIQVLRSETRFV